MVQQQGIPILGWNRFDKLRINYIVRLFIHAVVFCNSTPLNEIEVTPQSFIYCNSPKTSITSSDGVVLVFDSEVDSRGYQFFRET